MERKIPWKKMTTFHRPKLFRSGAGCCICKAKSSSSRFTLSAKYEGDFRRCFKLSSLRSGDLCNACVLIVKRWRKLPRTNKKDWAHIVDAKGGPGSVGKGSGRRKTEDSEEKLEKIRRKFKVKPRSSRKLEFLREAKSSRKKSLNFAKSRVDQNLLTDFFPPDYWRRTTTCCGAVYVGLAGERMVTKTEQERCSNTIPALGHLAGHRADTKDNISISTYISSQLNIITDGEVVDEGFCDKASTNPSSPESVQTVTDEF